jgi:hypothetical protein
MRAAPGECDGIANIVFGLFIAAVALVVAFLVGIFWLGRATAAETTLTTEQVYQPYHHH